MVRIIAVANLKGGVGKTTTVINLGVCLGELKRRVLIVDMDPQQHITMGLGIYPKDIKLSTYNLLINPQLNPQSSIIEYSDNTDILPSHFDLSIAENELMGKAASDKRLFNQLMKIKDRYDFIIIDSPPSLGLLTINSLIASREVIITIEPESLAMQGVIRLLRLLKEIAHAHQKNIVFYILLTRFDKRTNLAKEVYSEVQSKFNDSCFNTVINNTVKLKEAMGYGLPIGKYNKSSKGYYDYSSLAKELLNKDVSNIMDISRIV